MMQGLKIIKQEIDFQYKIRQGLRPILVQTLMTALFHLRSSTVVVNDSN